MHYTNWNSRLLPFFREELIKKEDPSLYPSIASFRQKDIYTPEQRRTLQQYCAQCPNIVATSYERCNAYSGTKTSELAYYTDGEVIFNNFLFDYLEQEDFALPERWLAGIKNRDYILQTTAIDIDRMLHSGIDIFQMSAQTFDDIPLVKAFMK